jgi:hypothetical protein
MGTGELSSYDKYHLKATSNNNSQTTPLSIFRYIRRSLASRGRIGDLEGGKDSVKWDILKHIAITTPKSRRRYAELQQTIELPKVCLMSPEQINACYSEWKLKR